MRSAPLFAVAGLLALLASACGPPKACLRPGYSFSVQDPDGLPADAALVTFRTVERDANGTVTREIGREVSLAADATGSVVVGPLRGRRPRPSKGHRRATRITVSVPDGRALETFHDLPPRVACRILETRPLILDSPESPSLLPGEDARRRSEGD